MPHGTHRKRIARANVITSTREAPAHVRASAQAATVAPVVNTSSINTTSPATTTFGKNTPCTFRRRSGAVRPACRRPPGRRVRVGLATSAQRSASANPSACAGWCPRRRLRSGSGGTHVRSDPGGRASAWSMISAATRATPRPPRSFHAAITRLAVTSYTTADRADVYATRALRQTPHISMGHALGVPHRAHTGEPTRGNARSQLRHKRAPVRPQPAHRDGMSRSMSHTQHVTGGDVTALLQIAIRGGDYPAGTAALERVLVAHG